MKFIDLFAGIGGFRMGMEMAGHECVGWVESDPKCEKCKKITKHIPSEKRNFTICTVCGKEKRQHARFSYESIHNSEGEWTAYDITEVSDHHIRLLRGKVDVICGGFPCQAFSVAGKRRGFHDTRGTLFFDIARFAEQIKPRFLFLENVKGLLSHEKGETFGTIIHTLDELGYDAEWQVLNSKDFGVPQNRERVFIIGHLRGSGGGEIFPITETSRFSGNEIKRLAHSKYYRRVYQTFDINGSCEALDTMQGGGRQPCVAVQAVLTPDRLEKRQNGRRFKDPGEPMFTLTSQDKHGVAINILNNEVKVRTDNRSTCLDANYYKGLDNHQMRTGVMVNEATKKGYDVAYPGDSINISVPNSKTRRGRVGKNVANTLETSINQATLTDDFRIRKLTPRECWRLQGFPDWAFDKAAEVNSDSQLYKQAGNSVTVPVIYEIAKRLV